ncbi:MAG: metallopeptidase TldD-related protein, partial [Myxococcota bacterium]|nr:metallopeptidase TldD-related protein [Myxococcota bacterium]
MTRSFFSLTLLLAFAFALEPARAESDSEGSQDAVLAAMESELARAWAELSAQGDDAPYFIGLQVIESNYIGVAGEEGELQGYRPSRVRWVHADVRVGDARLDSTHPLRESGEGEDASGGHELGLGSDPEVLGREIWREIDATYRAAVDRWQRVLSDKQVLVDEEQSWDLAPVKAEQGLHPRTDLSDVDVEAWEQAARRASAVFAESRITLDPGVSLVGEAETRWFVSTEGHRVREGLRRFRAAVSADTLDSDGTALSLHDAWDTASPEGLPSPEELEVRARELEAQLVLLAAASEQGPYRGPAVLSGKSSAVFFHEIFGHRVEGHRLKQVEDAQTFRNQVGQSILPSFLSVYDDPTLSRIGEQDLRGFYRFDDQGVRAERVQLVKDGVLEGFLESRSPVADRGKSNAHGRRQMGNSAVSRQGNLIVEASRQVPDEELRRLLIKAARSEGLEYGLLIDDIG